MRCIAASGASGYSWLCAFPSGSVSGQAPQAADSGGSVRRKFMKYLLAFLLTALSCGAQTPRKAPCLKLTKVKISRHVLHQGGKMDMRLTFTGNPCSFLTAPRNPDEAAPTTVTAREMPTITFKPQTDLQAKTIPTTYYTPPPPPTSPIL